MNEEEKKKLRLYIAYLVASYYETKPDFDEDSEEDTHNFIKSLLKKKRKEGESGRITDPERSRKHVKNQ